jgi:cell division protein FtsW
MSIAATAPRPGRAPASFLWDRWLVFAVLALLGLGLVLVASASIAIADRSSGEPFYYLVRQLVFLALGLGAAAFCLGVPAENWIRARYLLLAGAFVLLVAVLVPGVGREVNGAVRWLSLGPVNLQVSEPARLMILLYLSGYVAVRQDSLRTELKSFLLPLGFVALACILLLAQPDFGATTVLMATALAVLFAGGVRLRYFAVMLVLAALALGVLAMGSEYRLRRLTSFMDPWADPYNAGFQLTQSLIAIGRGEWFGVGLGAGVQKLFYLPEAHTDFVFAVFAEEFGLAGVLLMLGLYVIVVWRAFAIAAAAAARDQVFHASLAFGLGVWLGAQAFVNIGVNMGLLPTKGLTLPLVSYGGSSLIVCMAAVGLLLRVGHEARAAAPGGNRRRRTRA